MKAERDALRAAFAMLITDSEARAAWCLMGAPNEWMQGEAVAYKRSALAARRLLAPHPPTNG